MNQDNKLHAQPLIFSNEQLRHIDHILLQLSDQIAAPLVMLADISGRLIIYRGRLSVQQGAGLAVLAAGSFAANNEIGAFLGLREGFEQQLLEGRLADLYIVGVGKELLLIVAFTKQSVLGMVRVFTQQTQQSLLFIAEAAVRERQAQTEQYRTKLDDSLHQDVASQLDELFSTEGGLT